MARHAAGRVLLALLLALLVAVAVPGSTGANRVEGERQVWRVVMEHLNALNVCSLRRLMAQHPPAVTFFGAGGAVVRGRDEVRSMYEGFCKHHRDGGLAPFRFKVLESHRLGKTLYVRWRFTSPALSRPYDGADAYGTRGNQLVRVVSTFDGTELKFKRK
ncbi:hypothetical protein MMPV_002893 [Pyropia vietnamensis]